MLLNDEPSCRSAAPPKAAAMLLVSKKALAIAPPPAVLPLRRPVRSTSARPEPEPTGVAVPIDVPVPTNVSLALFTGCPARVRNRLPLVAAAMSAAEPLLLNGLKSFAAPKPR
jgi:hypothetical protein